MFVCVRACVRACVCALGPRSVFYFGYCYNRFWQMHELAVACKNALSGVCSLARGSQMTVSECQDIWRWLNLAHITGYVGLTHVYTRVNLLEGVAQTYGLFGRQSIEFKRLKELGLDGGTGNAAYGEFLVWVLRCISSASSRGVLDAATTENMQSLVLQMRAGMTGLYDYQFQARSSPHSNPASPDATWSSRP